MFQPPFFSFALTRGVIVLHGWSVTDAIEGEPRKEDDER